MPKALDEDKLNSPDLKILDINNPPVKDIPYQAYPKMLYLHPKDKTKEHRTIVVQDAAEHDAHEAKGWKTKPHIPVEPVENLSDEFEAAGAEDEGDKYDKMTKNELFSAATSLGLKPQQADKKEIILASIRAKLAETENA